MKPLFTALAAVILFMLIGLYFQLLYPPSVMKHNTEKALQQFADAVETQDRVKIAAALTEFFTADARVHLAVTFSAINSANLSPMEAEFSMETFLPFVDNVVYTVNDYHMRPKLQEFALENELATVQFTSTLWADGPSFYEGVSVSMHFSGDAQCSGEAVFENQQPKLRAMNCNVLLRSVTKTDAASTADTVKRATELREMLDQQQR